CVRSLGSNYPYYFDYW
nr:immunoglobulin heavy chain junction region [Mus musculus]